MRNRRLIVGLLGAGLLNFGLASSASADNPYFRQTRVTSVKYLGMRSGDWTHCVYQTAQPFPSTLTCSHNVTVSATFSASLSSAGYTASEISGGVGFNVTYASSLGNGESWPMKRGESGWGDIGFRYALYRVGAESRSCPLHGGCPSWSAPTYGKVQRVAGDTYRFFPNRASRR